MFEIQIKTKIRTNLIYKIKSKEKQKKIKEKKRKIKIQEPSATQISLSSRPSTAFLLLQLHIYRVLKLGPNFDAFLFGL